MYKSIIRPIFFKFAPERIHHITMFFLKVSKYIPGAQGLMRYFCTDKSKELEREVFGIKFSNPIGLAAGCDKNAEVYEQMGNLGFGFVEIGTVTPKAQGGNPKPRLFRLPQDKAIINRMGFNNLGYENALKNLKKRKNKKLIIGGNLGKNTLTPNADAAGDYLKLFRTLYDYVDYFVINISCPNIAKLGELNSKEGIKEILNPLLDFRRGQSEYRPVLLKISPDLTLTQIDETIEVLHESMLDGIVATNTTTSRENLKTPTKVINKIENGGLSGAPLTERSIEMVRYIHKKTEGRYPIIGVGGISTPEQAKRMLDAGASLVEVFTGFIYEGPMMVKRICKHLKNNQ
ncbi:MAG: quinone-dependent dihydroorotate dehydrogenase [Rikenellaceae bacterium]